VASRIFLQTKSDIFENLKDFENYIYLQVKEHDSQLDINI
jgi:hypothetical protein